MQAYKADAVDSTVAKWLDHSGGPIARPQTGSLAAPPAPTTGAAFHLKALWPAAAMLVLGLAGLAIATLAPTGKGDQYAVIAPPWYTLSRTIGLIRNAQGDIVEIGRAGTIVPAQIIIVHSRRSDFVSAAYGAGAWLVLDPMRLRGCGGFTPAGGKARP